MKAIYLCLAAILLIAPGTALTIDSLQITIPPTGAATAHATYTLSPPEWAAVTFGVVSPEAVADKITDRTGIEVKITKMTTGEADAMMPNYRGEIPITTGFPIGKVVVSLPDGSKKEYMNVVEIPEIIT